MSHTSRFTVVGNHLLQHEKLSLAAIGLAAHIQSVPEGTDITIRGLAARFPEGEIRIAAALRELEANGYLARLKVKLPGGPLVTHTYSFNCPEAKALPQEQGQEQGQERERQQGQRPEPEPEPKALEAPAPQPDPEPEPDPAPDPEPDPDPDPDPPKGGGAPAPVREAPRRSAPVAPPTGPAANLLRGLGATDPRLALSSREVHRLAPCVDELLAQGAAPDFVRSRLTNGLPAEVKYPAGLLASRLDGILPPQREPERPAPPPRPDPLQNCDRCDHAFRAPVPGLCNPCRRATGQLVA
ncbi:helix-turn-helix domain-containing protein [Streptomyces sp. NPDC004267]|uniref:helix-turn-helix domain-containing protein n=1 Tax=Streptomyces sp. NPDC004267 TaxID=3364694 RepID=UPI0036B54538